MHLNKMEVLGRMNIGQYFHDTRRQNYTKFNPLMHGNSL